MWRDQWFALGVIGAARACLACLTPLVALGAIDLGAWAGQLDAVLLLVLVTFPALTVHRYRAACRSAS